MKLSTFIPQPSARLQAANGKPVDIGGYYKPDDGKASAALRTSKTLNDILAAL